MAYSYMGWTSNTDEIGTTNIIDCSAITDLPVDAT